MKEDGFDQLGLCEHGNEIGSCEICASSASTPDESGADEHPESEVKHEEGQASSPSEEWTKVTPLTELFDRDRATIMKTAETYREQHPEWFAIRPHLGVRGGRPVEYYSPELVDALQREFGKFLSAPDDWLTTAELAESIGRHSGTVSLTANAFREVHPEWFTTYRHENGKTFVYYAPELIALVIAELTRNEPAPEGWLTAGGLSQAYPLTYKRVKQRAEALRATNPEWFRNYLSSKNVLYEYYSPELIALITSEPVEEDDQPGDEGASRGKRKRRSDIENRYEAPPNWQTVNSLSASLAVSAKFIQRVAESYREDHPDWYGEFSGPTRSGTVEYFAPALIDQITAEIQARPKSAPEGWVTRGAITKSLGVHAESIRSVVDTVRPLHPEWFRVYLDPAKKPAEHYAPELVEYITAELKDREVPAGWMHTASIAQIVGRSHKMVQRLADTYREAHPEWFRALTFGRKNEYYSPELVAEILREFGSRQEPPPGWLTQLDLASQSNRSRDVLLKFEKTQRAEHPEWFHVYTNRKGVESEHYSPELAAAYFQYLEQRQPAPEGWSYPTALSERAKQSVSLIKSLANTFRIEHPEWFFFYDSERIGRSVEHYAPELVERIVADIDKYQDAPEGWKYEGRLEQELNISASKINGFTSRYRETNPEWFNIYRDRSNKLVEHFSPQLVALLVERINTEPGEPPEGWLTTNQVANKFSKGFNVVQLRIDKYRTTHPQWFRDYKDTGNRVSEHVSPELVTEVKIELERHSTAPEGWLTNWALSRVLKVTQRVPTSIAQRYRASHPEWFQDYESEQGTVREHYAPELVAIINQEVETQEAERAPEGWLNLSAASDFIGIHSATLKKALDAYRLSDPGWFHEYVNDVRQRTEFYAPELLEKMKEDFADHPSLRRARARESEVTLERLSNADLLESKNFRALINVFGSSHAVDLIYRLHPSFRRMPSDRVNGMLAQYLGDFLMLHSTLDINGLETVKDLGDYLNDEDLREGFLEVVKGGCLTYYQEQRRTNPDRDAQEVIQEYFASVRSKVAGMGNDRVNDVLSDAEAYYTSLYLEQEKPSQIIPQLREGRVFPDINQRINIKEISDKRRVLIGDEMGLGKSASAILSKEYLGVRCALVVAPSNVIPTWQEYLSDRRDVESDRQIGYFNPGQAPRVLTVNSIADLEGIDQAAYDYVLLSQERLNERHANLLKGLDFDMLVVDEIHKLKNVLSGKRSQLVLDLAKRIEGDDRYLVMLSGTPVPNKIRDTALLLKMMYPEKFEHTKDDELVRTIIHGDTVEIRNLLVPRMQVKRLQESLDMPPLDEQTVPVQLSPNEEAIYEVLLEEDEMTASEKIIALRQFLLNPELLHVAPETPSAKVLALNTEIVEAFQHNDSIVVYVNGYVEGVIRGDQAIIPKLSLPEDVEIHVIDGSTPKSERLEIQSKIQRGKGRSILFVSGQTADVGVDFSQAEQVIFYNEPWTEYDKRQQLGRVYREGHTSRLESQTLIVDKTIEDGIHQYIIAKRNAIEKVLRGIPRSEMENRLLEEDERRPDENLEVNAELAEYYFSAWDRMLRIFGHVREMGEEEFRRFLDVHGEDYADCYSELGSRTYQANNSRVVGSMLAEMIGDNKAGTQHILDIGSGPEMLKKHLVSTLQDEVISLDINQHHFAEGSGKRVVGSFTQLPYRSNSIDYCNFALSLHYTKFLPGRGEYERLQVLSEMNRVLKKGGRGIISMIYNIEFKDPAAAQEAFQALGFKVVDEYSGDAENGDKYRAHIITVEKTEDIPELQTSNGRSLDALADRITNKTLGGLKFKRQKGFRLRSSRRIIDQATLTTSEGKKVIPITFNEDDRQIYHEEQTILSEGKALAAKYQGIEKIPVPELQASGYSRLIAGKRFILFKKLQQGEGAVIVR